MIDLTDDNGLISCNSGKKDIATSRNGSNDNVDVIDSNAKKRKFKTMLDISNEVETDRSTSSSLKVLDESRFGGLSSSSSSLRNEMIESRVKLEEIVGDLFTGSDQSDSLCHCVSEDFAMGKGIAVLFKNKFGGVTSLKQQNAKVGSIAVLSKDDRFIYYLITKAKYWHKPTMCDLEGSLRSLRTHCEANNVSQLSMPRIGCGLDHLKWPEVKALIVSVFRDLPIRIKVFQLS